MQVAVIPNMKIGKMISATAKVPKNIFIGHKKFIPAYLNKLLFVDKPKR